jgi:hypothetical protein
MCPVHKNTVSAVVYLIQDWSGLSKTAACTGQYHHPIIFKQPNRSYIFARDDSARRDERAVEIDGKNLILHHIPAKSSFGDQHRAIRMS